MVTTSNIPTSMVKSFSNNNIINSNNNNNKQINNINNNNNIKNIHITDPDSVNDDDVQ